MSYNTYCLQLQIRRSMSLNKVHALFSYCRMLGFSCRCWGSQQLERGSARFSYKSKCSALKRMEISFNCSLWCKRGLKFQLNLGRVVVIPSFLSVLYNIKLMDSFHNRNSQDPSPRGNWIPEQHPRRLPSPDQTIHCPGPSRYPEGLPIRWRRPPHNSPHLPPTTLFFLVTPLWWQLYVGWPQGVEERPDLDPGFGRTRIPSISSTLSPCYSINRRRVTMVEKFCNQRLISAKDLGNKQGTRTVLHQS